MIRVKEMLVEGEIDERPNDGCSQKGRPIPAKPEHAEALSVERGVRVPSGTGTAAAG
jgi:hypothetical protein